MTNNGTTLYFVTGETVTTSQIQTYVNSLPPTTPITELSANGDTLNNIPPADNVTIIFDGVLMSNYTLNGRNTNLVFQKNTYVFDNVSFIGTFYCEHLSPELFGAVGDGITDDTAVKSVAIIGHIASSTFNSCSMERFQLGCIGYSIRFVWNTPYVEEFEESITCVGKGCLMFNNMVGSQTYIDNDKGYAAENLSSKIILNNAHSSSFYPTYSNGRVNERSEIYNKKYYDYKAYIIMNHNKIEKPFVYNPSTYIKYEMGDKWKYKHGLCCRQRWYNSIIL